MLKKTGKSRKQVLYTGKKKLSDITYVAFLQIQLISEGKREISIKVQNTE